LECSGHQLPVQVALGIIMKESDRVKGLPSSSRKGL
jgi:hypothetical protein